MPKYDSLATLSTTSRQPSLDLIVINEDSLDFLELKKRAKSTDKEKHLKRLVAEKKVHTRFLMLSYQRIFQLLNENQKRKNGNGRKTTIKKLTRDERLEKHNPQKTESQKTNPDTYETGTTAKDDFLKVIGMMNQT